MSRRRTSANIEQQVLLQSSRRCAICFGLNRDDGIKRGQIAHIDRDNTNCGLENLVFLCLHHHDEYDSKTSQSKGVTVGEIKQCREELYVYISKMKKQGNSLWVDYTSSQDDSTSFERPLLNLEIYEQKIQVYRIVKQFLYDIIAGANITVVLCQGVDDG